MDQIKEVKNGVRTREWNLFEKILNEVNNLVFIRDRNGIFFYINQQFASFLDLPFSEIIGQNVKNLYPEDDQLNRALEQDEMILAAEEGFSMQMIERLNFKFI